MTITWIGAHANNYQKGRIGNTINKIIIHWIVGTLQSADATFQDPNRIASAHYGIANNTVHQYVKEEDTAYHAGNLVVNRQSIGIEHEGGPTMPITDATYDTSAQLVADLCRKYAIPVDRQHILRHGEISATECCGTLDVDKLVSMVASILAPVVNADTIAVDKAKFADFERCKDGWNQVRNKLNVEDNVTVVLAEIDKLIGYEDALIQKDKQLTQTQTELSDVKTQLEALTTSYNALQMSHDALQQEITTGKATIDTLKTKIEQLSSAVLAPVRRGWKKFLVSLIDRA
jgi:N-acetylmuramoyl-L-alanine amidase CwlA